MDYKIIQKPSPNQSGRNGWKPDMIVNHISEGYFGTGIGWLQNPVSKASCHFFVSKKGEIAQLVPIERMAWVNGTSTDIKKSNHYSKSTLKKVRERKTNANYYTIGIEHEGFSSQGKGALTEDQFKATLWLHKYIIKEVKRIYGIDIPIDRENIVGHYQIDPIRKPNCPGGNFQWDRLINELRDDKVEEMVKVALEKWKEEMGNKALDSLNRKQDSLGQPIVNSPQDWKKTLGDDVPQWLFWSIVDRISK